MRCAHLFKEPWCIADGLAWGRAFLAEHGIPRGDLDADVLLATLLKVDRIHLYAHGDQILSLEEETRFQNRIHRRAQSEPVAYICGTREFYGRSFHVNPHVLVPRPETEHLVDVVVAWVQQHGPAAPHILDIGTGSGVLAVTLAAELPQAHVTATDVSQKAIQVAQRNACRHKAHGITWRCGHLWDALKPGERFDIIVSNPPYVALKDHAMLSKDIRCYEPALALYGGWDGLDVLRDVCAHAPAYLHKPGLLALEIGAQQSRQVRAFLLEAGSWQDLKTFLDLQGHPRVIAAVQKMSLGCVSE